MVVFYKLYHLSPLSPLAYLQSSRSPMSSSAEQLIASLSSHTDLAPRATTNAKQHGT
jgi:hypothetical protein